MLYKSPFTASSLSRLIRMSFQTKHYYSPPKQENSKQRLVIVKQGRSHLRTRFVLFVDNYRYACSDDKLRITKVQAISVANMAVPPPQRVAFVLAACVYVSDYRISILISPVRTPCVVEGA